jgi:osmotically inducible protein OsmC
MIEKLYTAEATARGARAGHVKSSDGVLDLNLRIPKEMGGPGGAYSNPEQLFAAGYAACFDGALNLAIRNVNVKTGETSVTAQVSIGSNGQGGFGLAVELTAHIPGVDQAQADSLVAEAHQICPYSNATRGNIDVAITATTSAH